MTMNPTVTLTRSYENSERLFEQSRNLIPGGVNSPVRAFKGVGGTPPFIRSSSGAHVTDVDGNTYLDFVGSWGPMILGHTHPDIVSAVSEALKKGFSFGAPTEAEHDLASLIVDRVPGVDMVRLVNSGTEATMSALRLARASTGRDAIIKFNGCYHGHADAFLVAAGSGTLDIGQPDSPGVPSTVAAQTLVARFNDLASVEQLLDKHEVAAVIVEPVGGNAGCIPPVKGFLEGLRTLCSQHGALLIFDEVMTGFRIARGGAIERFGVQPDLVTFGKVIGGGFPIGAYAGPRDLMLQMAPAGPVYQAGTLSGNPVAVAAGSATLQRLDEAAYDRLETLGEWVESRLQDVISTHGLPLHVQRVGSMFCLFFTPHPVRRVEDMNDADLHRFNRFFHAMLADGFYLAPSAYECSFLSLAHNESLLDAFCDRASRHLTDVFH